MAHTYFTTTKVRKLTISLIFTGLFSYLCYHTINGERGILALFKFTNKIEKLHAELDVLRAERIYLQHKVHLVRSESLDLDLIDEQARKILGYASPEETIYFINNN